MESENTSKNGSKLPVNKKIIGELGNDRVIYMEDYVRSFIQSVEVDEDDEGFVGLLLGEVITEDGKDCVMIKGATEVTNAAVFKDKIAFTQETWPIANGTVNQYFRGMEIVGWYLVSGVITEEDLPVIGEADAESFDKKNQVFYYYNPDTEDESFYEKDAKANLAKSAGYACFYERNEAMQIYSSSVRQDIDYIEIGDDSEEPDTDLRDMVKEPKEMTPKKVKHHLTLVYAMSMILIIVVLVIGINSIMKIDEQNVATTPEETTYYVAQTSEPETSAEVIETTSGEDETTAPEQTSEEVTTEEETTQEPTTAEPTTAAVEYETYTVTSGDTLSRIVDVVYGTGHQDYVSAVKKFNDLANNNIDIGQTLKMPSADWCEKNK